MHPRVLIVDDDPALVAAVSGPLRKRQVAVEVVNSAEAALARAREGGLAVALIDHNISNGTSGELVKALRQSSPFVQSIILSAEASVENAAAAVGAGVFAYLLKPFVPEALLDTVERAVTQAHLLEEQERLRGELERSEQGHRQVIEAMPALVLAMDPQGRITLWNRRLEELTGFSRDEMLGRDGRAFTDEDKPCLLPLANGRDRLVKWQIARVGDGSRYALGVDVTREQEMQRRTLRAERLAAVGTLAAGLAHEVRNPLNAALLQLTLLSRRLEKPGPDVTLLRGMADVIRSEIQRLERLVDEFLAFARPRELAIAPVPINEVCAEVAAQAAGEAARAHVTIDLALADALPPVEGDRERLAQVLINLVRNGIEAMPDGGRVRVSTRKAGRGIEVEVADTGAGIADESAIFDAFYTTKPQGTGLGLALVHRIVADHGGQIAVSSRPGNTRFTVLLPVKSE